MVIPQCVDPSEVPSDENCCLKIKKKEGNLTFNRLERISHYVLKSLLIKSATEKKVATKSFRVPFSLKAFKALL